MSTELFSFTTRWRLIHSLISISISYFSAFKKFNLSVTSVSAAKLYDASGTEMDGDVFEEVGEEPGDLGIFRLVLENEGTDAAF